MIATDIDSLVKVNMKLKDNATPGIFKMFVFEILLFLFLWNQEVQEQSS